MVQPERELEMEDNNTTYGDAPIIYKARLYNDHDQDYTEEFKGEMITIPANGYIEGDHTELNELRGRWANPTKYLPDGTRVPNPKMLRLVKMIDADHKTRLSEQDLRNRCMECGYHAKSTAGLASHRRNAHPGAEMPAKPE